MGVVPQGYFDLLMISISIEKLAAFIDLKNYDNEMQICSSDR